MTGKKWDTRDRGVRALMTGACVFILLTGIAFQGWSSRVMAAERLNVMMNGGDYEKLARKLVVVPFERKYGVTVNITPGSGNQMLTRLKAEKSNPTQDCVIIDLGPAVAGMAEGVFEKINPANIPNLKEMDPIVLDKDGYGPIVHSHSIGLAYNAKLMTKSVPTSWNDLWNPIYKDTLLLVNITLTPGYLFLLHTAMTHGGSYENIEPGIEMIKKLEPNIRRFAQGIAELRSSLQSEDIITICAPNIPFQEAQKSGMPIKALFPKEGNIMSPATAQVVSGTKNKDLAEKFINEYLSPQSQMGWSVDYNIATFNKTVVLPPDVKERLPSKNILYDFRKIAENLEMWIEKFTREVKL